MPLTPEEMIISKLNEIGKSIFWLADELVLTNRHLYYVLQGRPGEKRKLSPKLLERINCILDTDFKLPANDPK